jgi:hypothetical protein
MYQPKKQETIERDKEMFGIYLDILREYDYDVRMQLKKNFVIDRVKRYKPYHLSHATITDIINRQIRLNGCAEVIPDNLK